MAQTIPAELTCRECGAVWRPREPDPVRCPRCGTRHWKEAEKE